MGFTPLGGLVMGTRCGDSDPAVLVHIMSENPKMTSDEMNNLLNKQSGLLGISGLSGDMRAIVKAIQEGNRRAKLAFDMLCYSAKKYISTYYGVLNGVDGIVFTAGIGENVPSVREKSCENLENLGIELDIDKNNTPSQEERFISSDNSKVKIMIIPTNEELMIAREAMKVLTNH